MDEEKTEELVINTLTEIPPVRKTGSLKLHKQVVKEAIERGVAEFVGKSGLSPSIKKMVTNDYPEYDSEVTTRGKNLIVKMTLKTEGDGKGGRKGN